MNKIKKIKEKKQSVSLPKMKILESTHHKNEFHTKKKHKKPFFSTPFSLKKETKQATSGVSITKKKEVVSSITQSRVVPSPKTLFLGQTKVTLFVKTTFLEKAKENHPLFKKQILVTNKQKKTTLFTFLNKNRKEFLSPTLDKKEGSYSFPKTQKTTSTGRVSPPKNKGGVLLKTKFLRPNTVFKKGKLQDLFTMISSFDIFFKKFRNLVMRDGKKVKASQILFTMLVILKKRLKKEVEKKTQKDISKQMKNVKPISFTLLRVIMQALDNLTPSLQVRKVRVGGSTYLVPAVLSKKKQQALALKWLLESAKKRQKISHLDFSTCLADEFLEAYRKSGQARQKRDELHRVAQMNRAYIRYRWW